MKFKKAKVGGKKQYKKPFFSITKDVMNDPSLNSLGKVALAPVLLLADVSHNTVMYIEKKVPTVNFTSYKGTGDTIKFEDRSKISHKKIL